MNLRAPPAQCDYCGLPLWDARPATAEPRYCCYGCRFGAAVMRHDGDALALAARASMTRLGLAVFFSMNVMVFTFFLWSEPAGEPSAAARVLYDLARYASLLMAAPVILLLGGPLASDAWDELRRGRASMNLLLWLGVVASFVYSLAVVLAGAGHVYFEVGCMVLVAVTLGRWLEATGKLKTTAELRRLQQLLPDEVRRLDAAGNDEWIPLREVRPGDVLRCLPGELIAVDGRIARGEAAIDQTLVTGESAPVTRQAGDAVHSGTTNLDGELRIEVTAPPGAGTMERLISAVLEAAQGRTRWERLAERSARWFLPLVAASAAGTLAWHGLRHDWASAIMNSLAVVVISCPCALALATPMALWGAIGQASRRHVLVREGDAFALLANASTVCFDKTGTLTDGCEVTSFTAPAGDRAEILSWAAGLARGSHHPLSTAIVACADEHQVAPAEIVELRATPGRGVRGRCARTGRELLLGSPRWLRQSGVMLGDEHAARVCLAVEGQLCGAFATRERLRPQAAETLAALRAIGMRVLLLSGDDAARANEVARELGCEVRAPLLPDEKLAALRVLQDAGERVVMVGDGLNDAPALAAADVGIALGCGADVSRWSGSLCLLNDALDTLPWLVTLSRHTTRTIRWNLLWAFGYNALSIPLAATGWLHPALAAGAMVASSLLVVSNSLRLAGEDLTGDLALPLVGSSAASTPNAPSRGASPAWEPVA